LVTSFTDGLGIDPHSWRGFRHAKLAGEPIACPAQAHRDRMAADTKDGSDLAV
jgi:hypothetical protein